MDDKPIKQMSINSPSKNSCTAEHFVKFILLPQYKGMQDTWPKHTIQLSIMVYEDSEGLDFFEKVNKYLKKLYPTLLGKYILLKKD